MNILSLEGPYLLFKPAFNGAKGASIPLPPEYQQQLIKPLCNTF